MFTQKYIDFFSFLTDTKCLSISELTQMKSLINVYFVANAFPGWKTSKFTTDHIQVGYDAINVFHQKGICKLKLIQSNCYLRKKQKLKFFDINTNGIRNIGKYECMKF